MSQLSSKSPLAAGVGGLPSLSSAFAATQGAWRFYANDAVTPAQLAAPLIAHVDQAGSQLDGTSAGVVAGWPSLSRARQRPARDFLVYRTKSRRHNPLITPLGSAATKEFYLSLRQKVVTLIAAMRKFLIILNSIDLEKKPGHIYRHSLLIFNTVNWWLNFHRSYP